MIGVRDPGRSYSESVDNLTILGDTASAVTVTVTRIMIRVRTTVTQWTITVTVTRPSSQACD